MSLLTSAQFQQFLSVAGETMSVADIAVVTDVSESRVDSLCGREFLLHWENETIEVAPWDTRRYQIKTNNYPIIASSVMLTNTSALITNDNLIIEASTGIIKRRSDNYYFDVGRDAILLMYQNGYASGEAPKDLQYLIYKVGYAIKAMPGVVYQAETSGDYSYKMANEMILKGLDSIALAIVTKYKKVI